ncbi:MAG: hypothetical protein JO247_15515 [Chloroflexi bacterium]|nr:hypothetical protein [Chloroflexota bacterium]
MSREAVNQIIDRAVADDSFFELMRNDPNQAVAGYDLDEAELSAIRAGAYNVVVRATRTERDEQAALAASKAAQSVAVARPTLAETPAPAAPKPPIGGLIAFFAGVAIIAGGIAGFRYLGPQHQWPWQALGLAKPAAQPSIPAPTLGARPKPSATGQAAASPSAAAPSAAASSPAAISKPSGSAAGNGQAQLRPSTAPSASASASAAASASGPQQAASSQAYYQAVGARMANVMKSFSNVLTALRAGNDPTKDLNDLTNELTDLKQHIDDAPPPDQLKQQHQTLGQAIPIIQSNVDPLKTAVAQKNNTQAVLYAAEIDAILNQMPDELSFATQPHPELYQAIDSSQQLGHIVNFDVISQNVTARSNTPAAVVLRIGLQSGSPSQDEVSDTLRHGVVAARQTYPQAGQVRIIAFSENNGAASNTQLGTADWYCSPDARPPDASNSNSWQDSCSKIYVTLPGNNPSVVPY